MCEKTLGNLNYLFSSLDPPTTQNTKFCRKLENEKSQKVESAKSRKNKMPNRKRRKPRKILLSTRRPIPHYSPFPSSGEREKEGGRLPQDIMNKTAHKLFSLKDGEEEENKLASLEATLVRNYDRLTD